MFRTSRLVIAACALALAVGCDDAPTSPSQDTAMFTAQLSPANEVPPITNAEATGTGTASIELVINRDSGGAIVSATANFQVSLTGFPPGTPLTMAHIHRGTVGVIGVIEVDTGLTAGEVLLTTGSGTFTKVGIGVTPTIAQQILSNPAGFYFNVHSVLNSNGMARGQLVRQ
jgi:hypothetical protein